MIIDDSALIRQLLTEVINSDDRFTVCGAAQDPYEARQMIKTLRPDVLTLDIEMPRMNGITFLKNLMRLRPMPVLMISTLTQQGAPEALEALALGAVDYIGKPRQHSEMGLAHYRMQVLAKLHAAAIANLDALSCANVVSAPVANVTNNRLPIKNMLCAIGSSTGGTEALKVVLSKLPSNSPPIVVAQHIPAGFSASLARRLDSICGVNVQEAHDHQEILPGNVYFARGGTHLKVIRRNNKLWCSVNDGELVNHHKPSVEVLFDSVREVFGKHALAVMLTGMGNDGGQAMLRMHQEGCHTIAQDEKTSVVWGMPGVAVQLGAVTEQAPVEKIADAMIKRMFCK